MHLSLLSCPNWLQYNLTIILLILQNMKLPPNILNAKGRAAKGTVTLSSARSEPPVYLQEFGHKLEGTTLTCYALTAPGDIINLDFAFNPCTAEFCDIIVDGVRRKTTTIPSSSKYVYRSSFDRVLFSSRTANKRSAIKNCRMQVKAQDHSEGNLHLTLNAATSNLNTRYTIGWKFCSFACRKHYSTTLSTGSTTRRWSCDGWWNKVTTSRAISRLRRVCELAGSS